MDENGVEVTIKSIKSDLFAPKSMCGVCEWTPKKNKNLPTTPNWRPNSPVRQRNTLPHRVSLCILLLAHYSSTSLLYFYCFFLFVCTSPSVGGSQLLGAFLFCFTSRSVDLDAIHFHCKSLNVCFS